MAGTSSVTLWGNLTRDPDFRSTREGKSVCGVTVAISKKYGNRDIVVFIDCTFWGKTAEIVSEKFHKGDPIYVEGKLEMDQWDDKTTGQKRSKIKLNARTFSFLPGGGDSGRREQRTQAPKQAENFEDVAGDGIPF